MQSAVSNETSSLTLARKEYLDYNQTQKELVAEQRREKWTYITEGLLSQDI